MPNYNARLIEKDIFADVSGGAGTSDVVDLNGASKFSIQSVYSIIADKTFDSGGVEIDTGTFPDFATIAAGDYIVINDTAGLSWAVAADKDGNDPAPTGAIWVAIPAARKAQANLTGLTTAAQVATAFQDAFNALVDVPFVANDSTADVVFTQDLRGVVSAPGVHNTGDTGAGTITVAVTDAGVNSEVNGDEITIPSHNFYTGLGIAALSSTGTLPDPLLTATEYFVIVVDANTIKLAATEEDALAGEAITLTDQGSDEAVNTVDVTDLTGGSITFQKSNDGTNWTDIQAATSVSAAGSVFLDQPNVAYRYFRAVKAASAGGFNLIGNVLVIGDAE